MKKILPLIILAFYATSIFAQIINFNQGRIKQKHYLQQIPYQKIEELLVVPVTINGKNYQFAFDTGAPLVVSDKIFKELSLPAKGQMVASDAEGKKKKMRLARLQKIHLQGITFMNTPGYVFHEDSEWFECLGIDGIIGSNMLRHSVVQFDEENKQIIIADHIKKLSLQTKEYQPMKLSIIQSNPYFSVTIQKEKERAEDVLFDSGYGGFLALSINKFNCHVVDTIAESEGRFGLGAHGFHDSQKYLLLKIPELVVNKLHFNDVIITTTHSGDSRLGAELLQFGRATLDYQKKRFYFEPYEHINADKLSEIPKLYTTIENDKLIVGIIWDKTLESQINLGDEILSINGMDIQSMSFCELFLLKFPESDKCILELRDIITGAIKTVEIERMQLNKE